LEVHLGYVLSVISEDYIKTVDGSRYSSFFLKNSKREVNYSIFYI